MSGKPENNRNSTEPPPSTQYEQLLSLNVAIIKFLVLTTILMLSATLIAEAFSVVGGNKLAGPSAFLGVVFFGIFLKL